MKNRLWGCIALGCLLFSEYGFAENCKEHFLYEDGKSKGRMEESSRTFPEAPEWSTNWGDLGEMKYPYIRLSGMRNYRSDWTGALIFDELPVTVSGGMLKVKVRSTQDGNFGLWLIGPKGIGKMSFHTVLANHTESIEIPVENLVGQGPVQVEKIGMGLFGVPANQYTTLFVDDIALTCVQETQGEESGDVAESAALFQPFAFSDTDPSSVKRESIFVEESGTAVSSRYDQDQKEKLKKETKFDFVLPAKFHNQILNFKSAQNMTPAQSRMGWYNGMFFVEKSRLEEGVIADPVAIFNEAGSLASASEYRTLPLLMAELDYGVEYCADTTCTKKSLEDYHLLLAGLPTSYVSGSRIRLVYDPYYAISQKTELPLVDVCVNGKCKSMKPKSEVTLEFESAGIQKIQLKIHSGSLVEEQTLFVEVR